MVMQRYPPSLIVFLAGSCLNVLGQTTRQIVVGLEASVYDPGTQLAAVGDIINFVFSGDVHTVTQGSFDKPCVPLPGGFSSGFAGVGPNLTGPVTAPVWSLVITNTDPIWFFCQATRPVSHCGTGMVGAINPPSIEVYQQYVAAAKLVTSIAMPIITPVLSGMGAFATSPPINTTTFITAPISMTSPTSVATGGSVPNPTSSPSPVSTAITGKSHTHAIVGGVVGGVIGAIGLITIIFLIIRYRRNSRNRTSDFFRYNVPSDRERTTHNHNHNKPVMTESYTNSNDPSSRNTRGTFYHSEPISPPVSRSLVSQLSDGQLAPIRLQSPPLQYQSQQLHATDSHEQLVRGRQPSFMTMATSSSQDFAAPERLTPVPEQQVNLQALAREVASVLLNNHENNSQLMPDEGLTQGFIAAPRPEVPRPRELPKAAPSIMTYTSADRGIESPAPPYGHAVVGDPHIPHMGNE